MTSTITNNKLIEMFRICLLEQGKAESTIYTYMKNIQYFEKYLYNTYGNDSSFINLSKLDAQDFKRHLMNGKLNVKTINKKIEICRALYKYLVEVEYIDVNVFDVVKPIRIQNRQETVKWLDRNEKNALIRCIENKQNWGKSNEVQERNWLRNRIIIYLMLLAGLRTCEVVSLNLDNINLVKCLIYIEAGKGSKFRRVEINNELCKVLKEYIAYRKTIDTDSDALLISQKKCRMTDRSIHHLIGKIRTLTNINDLSAHMLRHTFGHDLAERGVDIRIIADIMGHSDINTTRIYIKSSQEERRKALETLSSI